MTPETKKPCTAATAQDKNESKTIQNNNTTKIERSKDAVRLSDCLLELQLQLDRAEVAMQDLYDQYLGVQMTKTLLEYYHDTALTRGDIVMDYLAGAQQELKPLQSICDALSEA